MTARVVRSPAASAIERVGSELRAAIAMLTRLPVATPPAAAAGGLGAPTTGAAAFPVAGVVVGAIGALPLLLAAPREPMLAAILALAAMAALTGALHLDGLADTADALAAPDPARAEQARKDPATGAAGVVTLILVIGLQVAALASIAASAGNVVAAGTCVVAAVISRTLPVLAARLARDLPGVRGISRFGAWFIAGVGTTDAGLAVGSAVVLVGLLSAVTRTPALAGAALIALVVGAASLAALVQRRGQLDGDGFGAAIELTMSAALVASAVLV